MEKMLPKSVVCSVLAAVCACSSLLFISRAAAAPIAITDTTDTTWRNTDGSYTFKDGLSFTFDGSSHTDRLDGGISVYTQKNDATRVIHAEGDLSITQKNGYGTHSRFASSGAYVYGAKVASSHTTPSTVFFEGDTIHLTGLFDGTPPTRYGPNHTYGLYLHGTGNINDASERTASVYFDNKNTYLTASYQSTKKPWNGTVAYALHVDHAAEAVFNSNAYLTTTLNEHGDINGAAVKVDMGKAIFNGGEAKLDVTSQNTESSNRTLWGVNAQGILANRKVQTTPYELVQFNSPTTDITVTSTGKSGAVGVYTQLGDVNFTNQVRNLSIAAKASGEGGSSNRTLVGLYAYNYGTINSHAENTRITTDTDDSSVPWTRNHALFVYATGHINMDGSRLDIQSRDEKGDLVAVYASGTSSKIPPKDESVTLPEGNTISLNADTMTITATGKDNKPSYAVYANAWTDSATININSDDAGSDQGKTLNVTGNVYSSGGQSDDAEALVNMNFTNAASSLRGRSGYSSQTSEGILNFKFNHGAVWEMTGNSSVTNLDANNSGTVDMRADENRYSELHARTLSGHGGIFKEDVDVRSMEADRIYVSGNFSGTQDLDIYQKDNYVPQRNTTEGNGLVLATVNGDGTFTARDREGTLFYTHYDLAHKDSDTDGYETDWYLNRIYHVDPEVKPTPTVEESTASYGLAYYTWRTEVDKLLQRMGELRHNGEDAKGLWARVKGSKIGRNGKFGFENKYQHYELGYDDIVKREEDLTRYQGVSFSYLNGDGTYHNGTGSSHGGALSFYNTDIRSKGHYLDLVFKIGHYHTDYTAYTRSGERIRGDFGNTGVALSAEYGRKKLLSDDGWYIEPQTQLSLGYFGGDNYTTGNGVHIHQDGIKSAIGRVGFNFGKDLGEKSKVYLKANLYHDFAGHGGITMTDSEGRVHLDEDYGDTWFMYGIGTAFQMGKNSHFYCDLERSTGSTFHTNWQWNVGMRFNF